MEPAAHDTCLQMRVRACPPDSPPALARIVNIGRARSGMEFAAGRRKHARQVSGAVQGAHLAVTPLDSARQRSSLRKAALPTGLTALTPERLLLFIFHMFDPRRAVGPSQSDAHMRVTPNPHRVSDPCSSQTKEQSRSPRAGVRPVDGGERPVSRPSSPTASADAGWSRAGPPSTGTLMLSRRCSRLSRRRCQCRAYLRRERRTGQRPAVSRHDTASRHVRQRRALPRRSSPRACTVPGPVARSTWPAQRIAETFVATSLHRPGMRATTAAHLARSIEQQGSYGSPGGSPRLRRRRSRASMRSRPFATMS